MGRSRGRFESLGGCSVVGSSSVENEGEGMKESWSRNGISATGRSVDRRWNSSSRSLWFSLSVDGSGWIMLERLGDGDEDRD